eukprot:6211069-Pleurochrysis_carterae.AAC.1
MDVIRARIDDVILPADGLDAAVPITDLPQNLMPIPCHMSIGAPLEGVRFSKYDHESCQDVEGYTNCCAYIPSAGIIDEATVTRHLRKARKQRVRDARKQQQTTSRTPAPAQRLKQAPAPQSWQQLT